MKTNKNFSKFKSKNLKEESKVKITKKYDEDELTDKQYNELKNKCFFFLRRIHSQNDILENNINFKPLSNNKRKKKYKNLIKKANLNKAINKIEIKGKSQKKEEKIIYDNYLPKTVWLNCKRIYNKYKNECKPLVLESIKNLKKSGGFNNQDFVLNKSNKRLIFSNDSSFPTPPSKPKFERGNSRTKSLLFPKNRKAIKFGNRNILHNPLENNKNNFIHCMDEKIKENFENKGINYILEVRDLENITQLPKFQSEDELNLNKIYKRSEKNKNLPFMYRRRTSIVLNNPFSLDHNKKINAEIYFKYKINSFFEIGNEKGTNKEKEEEENDLEIISKEGNVIIRELLFSKKENLEGYKENQSIFNFFSLKKLFELNDYNIFGVINGKGKESKKFSRLLKEILIEKFSNEINYLNSIHKSNPKNFKYKNDFIFNTLTYKGFTFLKEIFNSLCDELKKKGVDIEETGATLFIIVLIKDKIISIKIGDMYSYFIYSPTSDKKLNHVITMKPHFEHLISNIIEQDRFEENKCEFKLTMDELGQKSYEIIHNDKEIQKYITENNINFTRMVGFQKLKKIGIIGEPDIQMFSLNYYEDQIDFNSPYRKKKNSDTNINFINSFFNINEDQSIEANLKYIIIGNNELFEILKNNYYIKEINEAILKDEESNKKKDNIKYCFNLKNVVKKLVDESVEIHKKYMNLKPFKERCLALLTFTYN